MHGPRENWHIPQKFSECTGLIFTEFSEFVDPGALLLWPLNFGGRSQTSKITISTFALAFHNEVQYGNLFHRRTRASYVYNGCLAWYNVVLTPLVHLSVKFVGLPLATRATVD